MFAFCDQGCKIISCILDKVLAPPHAAKATVVMEQTHVEPQQEQMFDATIGGFVNTDFEGLEMPSSLGQDADFMLWLENMDWEKAGGAGVGGGWTGF
jgi:hypothetical protein